MEVALRRGLEERVKKVVGLGTARREKGRGRERLLETNETQKSIRLSTHSINFVSFPVGDAFTNGKRGLFRGSLRHKHTP